MPGARWFPGGTLNYAEQALAAGRDRPDDVAVVARSQTRGRIELTWARARRPGAPGAPAGLRAPRRRAAATGSSAYAPNIPETLVAFLATGVAGRRLVELRAGVRRRAR